MSACAASDRGRAATSIAAANSRWFIRDIGRQPGERVAGRSPGRRHCEPGAVATYSARGAAANEVRQQPVNERFAAGVACWTRGGRLVPTAHDANDITHPGRAADEQREWQRRNA